MQTSLSKSSSHEIVSHHLQSLDVIGRYLNIINLFGRELMWWLPLSSLEHSNLMIQMGIFYLKLGMLKFKGIINNP
ncbi:hypothetical protein KFK09_018553 [Dendrobium nobile]|uniref:Uncharacterized protein n=1 Tax=Dendrobium nobile TaxID=94219 RepID=A0A8T3AW56_DENNO|nr:hypothetical protein KFK09_018553 [Dendrobium nobile]